MRESQIHDAFMAWLKKQGLLYVHSTFGKKSTMTKNMPDFIILHADRCLLVECKTEKGALTPGQHARFAEIQIHSGMVVQIARTVEQAVSAVETWLGVEKPEIRPPASSNEQRNRLTRAADMARERVSKLPKAAREELMRKAFETIRKGPRSGSEYHIPVIRKADLWIAGIAGVEYVFSGDPSPGGLATKVRRATSEDIRNLPRR